MKGKAKSFEKLMEVEARSMSRKQVTTIESKLGEERTLELMAIAINEYKYSMHHGVLGCCWC